VENAEKSGGVGRNEWRAKAQSLRACEELARKTKFPEASISAQLRHLRKEGHGAFRVEKRRREWQEALKTNAKERVWQYQVRG
jgi:hypothetical protein